MSNIFIIECRNARRDVLVYSVEADTEEEAKDIFETMKNKGETFSRIRETLTHSGYIRDRIVKKDT